MIHSIGDSPLIGNLLVVLAVTNPSLIPWNHATPLDPPPPPLPQAINDGRSLNLLTPMGD